MSASIYFGLIVQPALIHTDKKCLPPHQYPLAAHRALSIRGLVQHELMASPEPAERARQHGPSCERKRLQSSLYKSPSQHSAVLLLHKQMLSGLTSAPVKAALGNTEAQAHDTIPSAQDLVVISDHCCAFLFINHLNLC